MVKKILLVLAVVLVIIQFIRPDKNDASTYEVTEFVEETKPNKSVLNVLEAKCFDCHSNKTTYPWYSNIAPLSFWINHHVDEGKHHLNFSKWAKYKSKRKHHKLEELIEEVEDDKMPLKTYEILHGDLSDDEAKLIMDWAKQAMANY